MQFSTLQVIPGEIDTDIVVVYSDGNFTLQRYSESNQGRFTIPHQTTNAGAVDRMTFYAFPKSKEFTVTKAAISMNEIGETAPTLQLQPKREIHLMAHILYEPKDINMIVEEFTESCRRTQEVWDNNRFGVQIKSHDIYIPREPIPNTTDDEVPYGIALHGYANESIRRYPEYHHILYVRSLGGSSSKVGWCTDNGTTKYIILTEGCSGELLCHELGHMYNLAHTHSLGECGADLRNDKNNIMSKHFSSRDTITYGQTIRAHFLQRSYMNRGASSGVGTLLIPWDNQGCSSSEFPPIGCGVQGSAPAAGGLGVRTGAEMGAEKSPEPLALIEEMLQSDCRVGESESNRYLSSLLTEETAKALAELIEKGTPNAFAGPAYANAPITGNPPNTNFPHAELKIASDRQHAAKARAREALFHYNKNQE